MSSKPIDPDTGLLNAYDLCPGEGDSMWVMNCGDHFEIRYYRVIGEALRLTEDDMDKLRRGEITWQ